MAIAVPPSWRAFGECPPDCFRPSAHVFVADQAHFAPGLPLQHAHQIGVGHRRQRMVLHAALVQQHIADEQIARKTARPLAGKAGQAIVKSVPSASISASATGPMLPRSVESNVEQYLKKNCRHPASCSQRERSERTCADRLRWRRRARLQRDHDGVGVVRGRSAAAHRSSAPSASRYFTSMPARSVAPREIVGDAAEQCGHQRPSFCFGNLTPG